jgi:hypothetical protein
MKSIITIYISICVLCSIVLSCSHDKTVDEAELAAIAAKGYYDELLMEHYDAFVSGRYQPEAIPASYREQLVANAKMFVGQQKEERHGIKSVEINNANLDSLTRTVNVFLLINYGDRTSEQIVVPMIKHKNVWYMK